KGEPGSAAEGPCGVANVLPNVVEHDESGLATRLLLMVRDIAEASTRRPERGARRQPVAFVLLRVAVEMEAHLVGELAAVRVTVDEDGEAMAQRMQECHRSSGSGHDALTRGEDAIEVRDLLTELLAARGGDRVVAR